MHITLSKVRVEHEMSKVYRSFVTLPLSSTVYIVRLVSLLFIYVIDPYIGFHFKFFIFYHCFIMAIVLLSVPTYANKLFVLLFVFRISVYYTLFIKGITLFSDSIKAG